MAIFTPVPSSPRMLTNRQVAEALQIDRKTLYRWTRAGKIPPPVRIGRTLRWPADAIDKLLTGQVASGAG